MELVHSGKVRDVYADGDDLNGGAGRDWFLLKGADLAKDYQATYLGSPVDKRSV